MFRSLILLPVLLGAGLAAGCGSNSSTTLPDTTPAVTVSEAFSGTVTVNGAITHPFTVDRAGTITAELTALSPDDSVIVGLALGTWNGSSCAVGIANDTAKLASAVIGNSTGAGQFCVRVFDVGKLTRATDYALKVDHF